MTQLLCPFFRSKPKAYRFRCLKQNTTHGKVSPQHRLTPKNRMNTNTHNLPREVQDLLARFPNERDEFKRTHKHKWRSRSGEKRSIYGEFVCQKCSTIKVVSGGRGGQIHLEPHYSTDQIWWTEAEPTCGGAKC